MVNIEKIVSSKQLTGDKKTLAETIGLDAYKKLSEHRELHCQENR